MGGSMENNGKFYFWGKTNQEIWNKRNIWLFTCVSVSQNRVHGFLFPESAKIPQTHIQKHTPRYTLDTVTSRSTSTDKTDHSIHLWVSALSAPFICGWVDQADQHFSHHWSMIHLWLCRNVTGLNALICHRVLAAGQQWQTHVHRLS